MIDSPHTPLPCLGEAEAPALALRRPRHRGQGTEAPKQRSAQAFLDRRCTRVPPPPEARLPCEDAGPEPADPREPPGSVGQAIALGYAKAYHEAGDGRA